MGRNIEDFKGKNAVVACGYKENFCHMGCKLHPKEDYFSINFDPDTQPDLVFDITGNLDDAYRNKFHITLVECLDFDVYNPDIDHLNRNKNGQRGFDNILSMTQDNGFVVIVGCPRLKNYRACVQDLNYIELNLTFRDGVILIPKNQEMTIEELNRSIRHDPELKRLVKSLNTLTEETEAETFMFCEIHYDALTSLRSESERFKSKKKAVLDALVNKVNLGLTNFLNQVKKDYPKNEGQAQDFVLEAREILQKECPFQEKIEGIKSLEKIHFKHHDPLRRLLIDLLWIPLSIITLGAGFALKKYLTGSYTFFGEPSKVEGLLAQSVPDLRPGGFGLK